MARLLIIGVVAALVLTVFTAVDCVLTERSRVRALPKPLWLVLVIVLPVVGPVLWFLLGRGSAAATPVRRPIGPDDDPSFLRPTRPAPAVREPDEAEWRSLEQELANLDAEAHDADPDDDAGEPERR